MNEYMTDEESKFEAFDFGKNEAGAKQLRRQSQSNMTDLPLPPGGEDSLGAISYVQALANFISKVKTPMTISIQGPWGSGKTSFMYNLADLTCINARSLYPWPSDNKYGEMQEKKFFSESKETLGEGRGSDKSKEGQEWLGVWVNTWQYSLLKEDESAQIEILQGALDSINNSVKGLINQPARYTAELKKQLTKMTVGKMSLAALKVAMASFGLNPLALNNFDETVKEETKGEVPSPQKFRKDLIEALGKYKQEIKEKNPNFKGFIFFIDDMDRLEPIVAVHVLSLLKNLFDAPDCVFVIAVDYDIVVKGLEKRFGKQVVSTQDNEGVQTDNREFRSYFDKIIQLTFRVPTSQLNLRTYLKSLLEKIEFCSPDFLKEENEETFLAPLTEIIKWSCGKNPRAIKRLINNLSLVKELVEVSQTELTDRLQKENGLLLLSSIVALQAVYPKVYEYIVEHPNLSSDELREDSPEGTKLIKAKLISSEAWQKSRRKEITKLIDQIRDFCIQEAKDDEDDENDTTRVLTLFAKFTSTTSASTVDDFPSEGYEHLGELLDNTDRPLSNGLKRDAKLLLRTIMIILDRTDLEYSIEGPDNRTIKVRAGRKAPLKLLITIKVRSEEKLLKLISGRGENRVECEVGDKKFCQERNLRTSEELGQEEVIERFRSLVKGYANQKRLVTYREAFEEAKKDIRGKISFGYYSREED